MTEVLQIDRDAAANIWRDFVARPGECIAEKSIRSGGMDDGSLVQTLAAHRIAGQAELRAALEEIVASMADDDAAGELNWGHAKDALETARQALSAAPFKGGIA